MVDDVSQTEADYLLGLEKKKIQDNDYVWPSLGSKIAVPLLSLDGREEFLLDVSTSSIKLEKLTMQNRSRSTIILARLDINGRPHRNPDDVEIECPHLHLYREGYGDKWAFPIPESSFSDLNNRLTTVAEFMRYCNITNPPTFIAGLF